MEVLDPEEAFDAVLHAVGMRGEIRHVGLDGGDLLLRQAS